MAPEQSSRQLIGVKVFFQLPEGEWHGARSESLWAKKEILNNGGYIYEIDNIPFFTKAVSLGDKITAVENKTLGGLEFSGAVERSRNSTYRIIAKMVDFRLNWLYFEKQGCSYEMASIKSLETEALFAINVPDEANLIQLYEYMQRREDDGVWTFQEGFVGKN